MKKILSLAIIILAFGCKREEYLPTIYPTYEYFANGEKQFNLGSISVSTIDSATHDTMIFLYDDQNPNAVLLRFNKEKIESTLAYNDTVYYSDEVAFHYRIENGKLYGLFSFNAFNNFKLVEVTKGRFNDIEIK